jgi:hypothetical protein
LAGGELLWKILFYCENLIDAVQRAVGDAEAAAADDGFDAIAVQFGAAGEGIAWPGDLIRLAVLPC